jgi:acetyl esterase/lipase
MPSNLVRPPYDPELGAALAVIQFPPTITPEMVPSLQSLYSRTMNTGNHENMGVHHEERTIVGPGGDLLISIFRAIESKVPHGDRPGIFFMHGGGMVVGNRVMGTKGVISWVKEFDAVCISVEYRLPPEHPDPAPIEDCYAGLLWTSEHATELGIDPCKLMVTGTSSGGGLAAGVALLARDRNGPALCAQVLSGPMLDDRNNTVSSHQYVDEGTWSRGSNHTSWNALLGERAGSDRVSIYAAPARAIDLSGLPPAFIDCGSADVVRDETVAYATLLWAFGIQAELHVWPGGFHAFDMFAPNATLSVIARETRLAWLRRMWSS